MKSGTCTKGDTTFAAHFSRVALQRFTGCRFLFWSLLCEATAVINRVHHASSILVLRLPSGSWVPNFMLNIYIYIHMIVCIFQMQWIKVHCVIASTTLLPSSDPHGFTCLQDDSGRQANAIVVLHPTMQIRYFRMTTVGQAQERASVPNAPPSSPKAGAWWRMHVPASVSFHQRHNGFNDQHLARPQ